MRPNQLLVLLFVSTSLPVLAQCPAPAVLSAQLQTISHQPVPEQRKPLLTWKAQWERCGYAKDSVYVNGLLQIGMVDRQSNELVRATQIVYQATQLCRANHTTIPTTDACKALYRLGALYSDRNKTDSAISCLKQVIVLGKAAPNAVIWVGNAYTYLAYSYITNGDYQQALANADAGLQLKIYAIDKEQRAAKLMHQKAEVLNLLERYDEAQQVIEQAIASVQHQPESVAPLSAYYRLLGFIHSNKKQYTQAILYAQRGFELAKSINYMTANIADMLGFIYYQAGKYEQAIESANYALNHSSDPFDQAAAFNLIGAAYWKKGQFSKAQLFYHRAIIALVGKATYGVVNQLPKLEQIRLISNKEIFLDLLQDKADTWLDDAQTNENDVRRLRYALDTYKAADQMIDFMRWDHTAQESKLYWRKKTRNIYERAIETCYLLHDAEQAFRFFEKSRAVMLADKLNELGARQQLTGSQILTENQLREAVGSQQNELAGLTPDSVGYRSAKEELIARQDKLEDFLKKLEVSNPAYYGYKYDRTTTKLVDLQSHLVVRNASFMTYFIGDSALYLLGVTGDRATLRRQLIGGYNQTAQQFMALLADPVAMNRTANVAQFLKSGNALYRQLLAPLKLPAGAVIVSPDGSFIPFETLSRSAREPDYLVKNYAFSYAYSARLLLRNIGSTSRVAGLGERDFLGVAPVTFAATLKQVSLPGSDEALKPIADRFKSASLFTGPEATRRTFVTEAADARVIHLFTHATADTSNSEPLLYFADSTLRLSDLGDGGLTHTRLAVLAACKTGVGANQRGEGVFSLARGLAALGVPSVLTTLWSVENKATYKITDLFYEYLDQGLPKDEALQRAKQDWLSTAEGANQLPNAWAGLILIGDTEPLSRPVQWAWVAGSGLLLLGAGGLAWWWRRRYRAKSATSSLRPA